VRKARRSAHPTALKSVLVKRCRPRPALCPKYLTFPTCSLGAKGPSELERTRDQPVTATRDSDAHCASSYGLGAGGTRCRKIRPLPQPSRVHRKRVAIPARGAHSFAASTVSFRPAKCRCSLGQTPNMRAGPSMGSLPYASGPALSSCLAWASQPALAPGMSQL
jgi:hypothetical protein